MSCSVSRVDRGFKSASLVSICLLLASSPARSELPPASQLIRQVEEACKKYEEEHGEPAEGSLVELAHAQAYAGDYAKAMQIARPMRGLSKCLTLYGCWEIHFHQTGKLAEVPAKIFGDSENDAFLDQYMRDQIARVLAKAGRLEDAERFLPKGEDKVGSVYLLTEFYLFVAEHQAQRGDHKGAAASLKRARALSDPMQHRFRRGEWLEAMVKLWLRLGDREQALAAMDAALKLARDRRKSEKPNEFLALAWARLGKLHALLGHDKLARQALGEALLVMEIADQLAKDENPDYKSLHTNSFVVTVGHIGAIQVALGWKKEGTASYAKALAKCKDFEEDILHDGSLLSLVERQRDEGDVDGALQTLRSIKSSYFQALGNCRCAEKLASADKNRAAELFKKAETLAGVEPEPINSMSVFVKIAEANAKAGDLPAAKRCFDKALKVSRATKNNEHHPWIARGQIRVGLLDDAYKTTMAIRELEWRLLPLAELAHQIAKKEAGARKNDAKQ